MPAVGTGPVDALLFFLMGETARRLAALPHRQAVLVLVMASPLVSEKPRNPDTLRLNKHVKTVLSLYTYSRHHLLPSALCLRKHGTSLCHHLQGQRPHPQPVLCTRRCLLGSHLSWGLQCCHYRGNDLHLGRWRCRYHHRDTGDRPRWDPCCPRQRPRL